MPSRGRTRRAVYGASAARTRLHRSGALDLEAFAVAHISGYLAEPDTILWLDLCRPDEAQVQAMSEEFGLHELAVEDATQERQCPKLDRYASHLFISAYGIGFDDAAATLRSSEIAVFVLGRALITVRKDEGLDVEQVVARRDASPDLAFARVAFLLHGLLDVVVDGHFAAVQQLDDAIEALEDLQVEEGRREAEAVRRRTFELRESLVLLRRAVLTMREVVNALVRRDLHVVDETMAPYYQDVYDHVLRSTEWTESLRDLVTSILETNITIRTSRSRATG